jgi:hypothetical protein
MRESVPHMRQADQVCDSVAALMPAGSTEIEKRLSSACAPAWSYVARGGVAEPSCGFVCGCLRHTMCAKAGSRQMPDDR